MKARFTRWLHAVADYLPRPSRRLDEALAEALYRGLRHDEAMERRQLGLPPLRPPAAARNWRDVRADAISSGQITEEGIQAARRAHEDPGVAGTEPSVTHTT